VGGTSFSLPHALSYGVLKDSIDRVENVNNPGAKKQNVFQLLVFYSLFLNRFEEQARYLANLGPTRNLFSLPLPL